jgi:hypothetical protein
MDSVKKSKTKFFFKKPAKNLFWTWIAYQTVKGTLTLSLIWIPLLYTWLHS